MLRLDARQHRGGLLWEESVGQIDDDLVVETGASERALRQTASFKGK
jgi:hypothetical protein